MKIPIIVSLGIQISSNVLCMDREHAIERLSTWQYYLHNMTKKRTTLAVYSNKDFPEKKIREKLNSFLSKKDTPSGKRTLSSTKNIYCAIYPKKESGPFLKLFTFSIMGAGVITDHLAPASILALGVNALYEYLEAPAYAKITRREK